MARIKRTFGRKTDSLINGFNALKRQREQKEKLEALDKSRQEHSTTSHTPKTIWNPHGEKGGYDGRSIAEKQFQGRREEEKEKEEGGSNYFPEGKQGKWVTMRGRHIFIEEGKTLDDAIDEQITKNLEQGKTKKEDEILDELAKKSNKKKKR